METVGILKARSIEIVDSTFLNGMVTTPHCPGELRRPCTSCPHARPAEPPAVKPDPILHHRRSNQRTSLILCLWHERTGAAGSQG